MSAFFAVTYKVRKAHSVPIIENCPFSLYNSDPFTCSDPFLTTTKTFSVNLINCIVFNDQIPVASAKSICLFRQRHSASFQYVLMPLSSVMIVSHKYPPKYVCSFIAHTNIQNIVFFRIVKVSLTYSMQITEQRHNLPRSCCILFRVNPKIMLHPVKTRSHRHHQQV